MRREAVCLVAFSGGGDSTALLLAMHDGGLSPRAVHLDHRMDDGSGARAEQAAAIAYRIGATQIVTRRLDVPTERRSGESLEAAARRLRYAALDDVADELGADWILTAHHRDDQAETVLLRMMFGSGLLGLAGIQEKRGRILRPLLALTHVELLAAVAEGGLEPVRDPTNVDLRRPRNRVRRFTLPLLRVEDAGLDARLATLARAAFAARYRLLATAETKAQPRPRATPPAPFSYTLRVPGSISLKSLGLRFHLEPAAWQPWMAEGEPRRAALAWRPAQDETVVVRSRRPGDRLRPLGAPGERKLKELLIDRKVPRAERDALPLLFVAGKLAWVPGVTIAEEFRCRPGEPVWVARLEEPDGETGKLE